MAHIPQAMHLRGSTMTISGISAGRCRAAVGHTPMQGAGLQCRHLFGKAVFRLRPGSVWIRGLGAGDSKTAMKRFLVCECATAQAASHCLHPMQRSGCTKTVFITFSFLQVW